MKDFLIKIFYFLWFVLGIAIVVYNIFFSEHTNYQQVAKVVTVFVVCFVTAMSTTQKQKKEIRAMNESIFKDVIQDAFSDNEYAYNKLMKMLECYYKKRFFRMMNHCDSLLEECTDSWEYRLVYFFSGLSNHEWGLPENGIELYKKALEYDAGFALAWSNLGAAYIECGKLEEAENACIKAVTYDPKLAPAYTNLSVLYYKKGEPELSLDNALQALKIESNLTEALSSAAIAYKMLGDERNTKKYYQMYIANGGSKREIQKILSELD